MRKIFDLKNPDTIVKLSLLCWWIANIIQASFTELANDEAYYWMFAQHPDWGYFDHPPMTAWLVWLGNWIGGTLGVRLFFTILQPLYLYILWRIIRPPSPSAKDANLFFVISAAIPMLQLYGFIAVPDGPLMMSTALFLLFFKKFTENDSWVNTLLLGVSMAALAYSKYQGALVVVFAVLSTPRLLKNPKLYISALVTLVLFAPHLLWQYNHDWASFRYHLVGRNTSFEWKYITEYLMNLLLVFNPLYFSLYIAGWRKSQPDTPVPVRRALYVITAGFVIFFGLSAFRGQVQPQWIIPICFGLIMILFNYVRTNDRLRRYVMISGWVTIGLILVVRYVMIFNPIGIRFEIFDNKTSYAQVSQITDGKPVIYSGGYALASKYRFYEGGEVHSQANINTRTNQWQYWDYDTQFAGRTVIVNTGASIADSVVTLANGRRFAWVTVEDFRPVRKVSVEIKGGEIPETTHLGDVLELSLTLRNPYEYDVVISPEAQPLVMVWGHGKPFNEFIFEDARFTIPAKGSIVYDATFNVPPSLVAKNNYQVGFIIKYYPLNSWFNSKVYSTNILD